jgi:hypothetical protein
MCPEIEEIFRKAREENAKSLPPEKRVAEKEMCLCEGDGCTAEKGHSGSHVAHNNFGNIIHEWKGE